MSRNRRERWDEQPDVRESGYDSRESRRSRRSGQPDEEWPPDSRAAHDQDEWRYGDAAQGGYSGSAGHAGPAGYSGPHSYPGHGAGYPDDAYQNGAYQNGAYQDGAYRDSGGYGSYRNDDYRDSGYGGGLTDPRGMTDPRGITDPYGRIDPGHSGPRGTVDRYGAADSYGDSSGYDRTGYDSAGYDQAGYDTAGYNGAGYDADSPGWAGRGEGGHGGRDAYDSGSYGSYGDSGGYGGQGQYGGPAAYAADDSYQGHGVAGPGGGPATGYEYGGGYDDHGYDPGGGPGQRDQYPDGEGGYGQAGYPGEPGYPGDWRAAADDTGMTRRRNRGGDEIDPDDARHNNFFRGFGRGDDDYTHRPPKKRRRSKAGMVALTVIIIFLAVVVAGGAYGYKWYAKRHADWKGPGYGSVLVQVMPGAIACGPTMENTLVSKGVVASGTAFCDAAKSAKNSASLEPGYFRLHKHMSASAAWALITSPKSRVQTTVAIPDGLRASKIIAILASKTGIPVSQFQSVLKNDVSQLGLPSWAKGNYEGFLYPATYPIQPGTSALDILKTMVGKFNSEIASLNLAAKAKAVNLPEYHVIIEASLLEGEVGPQYYGKVARVIDNRLNQHWYLGLDSTVAFALNKYIYNLSQRDLNTPSLYNTTKHYGLPPGPIDSPDAAAIEAVLHPAPDSFTDMYFVTVNKAGKTMFTSDQAQFTTWSHEAVRNGV